MRLCGQVGDRLAGRHDGNAVEVAHGQEISSISGGDEVCLSGEGCGNDLVVVGIRSGHTRNVRW